MEPPHQYQPQNLQILAHPNQVHLFFKPQCYGPIGFPRAPENQPQVQYDANSIMWKCGQQGNILQEFFKGKKAKNKGKLNKPT